jgi:hypothetical protein
MLANASRIPCNPKVGLKRTLSECALKVSGTKAEMLSMSGFQIPSGEFLIMEMGTTFFLQYENGCDLRIISGSNSCRSRRSNANTGRNPRCCLSWCPPTKRAGLGFFSYSVSSLLVSMIVRIKVFYG